MMHAVAFKGTVVDTPAYGQLRLLKDRIVLINEFGLIVKVAAAGSEDDIVLTEHGMKERHITRLKVDTKKDSGT